MILQDLCIILPYFLHPKMQTNAKAEQACFKASGGPHPALKTPVQKDTPRELSLENTAAKRHPQGTREKHTTALPSNKNDLRKNNGTRIYFHVRPYTSDIEFSKHEGQHETQQ